MMKITYALTDLGLRSKASRIGGAKLADFTLGYVAVGFEKAP